MNVSKILTSLKNKLVPQLAEEISQKEDALKLVAEFYDKSEQVIILFDKLKTTAADGKEAIKDGKLDTEEVEKLIEEEEAIINDPVITDLRELLEGYTCSRQ